MLATLVVMVDSTVDTGQWRSLAEAARVLGISEKTARRRAKAGQLEARQIPTPRGPTWQVRVPTTVDTEERVDSQGTHTATMLELVRMVGDLQAKAEAAAMWQARAELLAERLAAAESRVLALTAPQSPQDASGAPEPSDPPPEPSPFPWPMPPSPNVRALAPWLFVAALLAIVVAGLAWPR